MKKSFFILYIFLLSTFTFGQVTYYVSLSGSGNPPYSTLATGANDIQTAVDAASDGDLILIDDGAYVLSSNIIVTKGVTIRSINGRMNATIDGNHVTRCFYIDHTNAVIDGFTITNGYNPSALNSGFGGGAIIINGGTIQNSLIYNNQARDGAGVAIQSGGLVLNSVLTNNNADNNSGSGYGGAVRMLNGGTVRGSLIHSNSSVNYGGGINIWNAGTIESCTITNNTAPNGAGVRARNNAVMRNTISYFNNGLDVQLSGSGYVFYNNCTTNSQLLPGSGNISDDPQFGSLISLNPFAILPTSTLIDAGINQTWMTGAFDLYGTQRIYNGTVDIGVFEYMLAPPGVPALVSPSDFAAGVSIEPAFIWNSVSGADSYTLQLASDDAFSINAVSYTGITDTTYGITGLSNNAQYFWRVKAVNTGGASAYSAARTFTTTTAIIPYLSWPIGGATVYTTTQIITWWGMGASYDLLYSINSDMSGATIIGNINGYNYTLTALSNGTTYYWQIRSRTSGGAISAYSSIESFATIPGVSSPVVPIPSWPVNGATVYTNSPTLYWYLTSYSTGLQYEIEYSTGAFTSTPNITGIASMYATLTGLTAGATYNWQVRSTDGTTTSNWSAQGSFTVNGTSGAPLTPNPSWPVGNAAVYTSSPTLYWYLNGYSPGLGYEVEYSTGALTGTPNVTGITTQNTTLSGLTNGTTYNWQVRSTDGITNSAWSVQESFVISTGSNGPIVPAPSWPVGGATVYVLTPTLTWYLNVYSAGLEYEVLYSTSSAVTGGVLQNATSTTTWSSAQSAALPALTPGATYYWQVRSRLASDHAQLSNYSTVESFVTNASSAPVVLIPGSPVGNVSIQTTSPTLSWILPTNSESPLTYYLEISNNPNMDKARKFMDLKDLLFEVNRLSDKKEYFWRVRSRNDKGVYSKFSDIASFITDNNLTGLKNTDALPAEFIVEQNYPNPFNPSTTIKYGIPKSVYVSVKIYDILGQEVKSLVESEKGAGTYEIIWNGNDNSGSKVSSGLYIVRVAAGKQIITKKMVLMK